MDVFPVNGVGEMAVEDGRNDLERALFYIRMLVMRSRSHKPSLQMPDILEE